MDATQPDLQGKLVAGRDIVNSDDDPFDDHGHGTYTAGIVGASTNNGTGIAAYCWACGVMPVKVLGATGSGSMSDVAAGIVWATDHGARVVSMSLGGTSASSTLASAVKYAHERGVVLVASAGNYGNTTKVYPAAYPEVIGVAGTDSTDALYSWSSYGSWVSVSAPGCNLTTGREGWYGNFCGTSSAAPAVAGIVGLAASLAPAASNTVLESAIQSTAINVGAVVAHGRVDALATLALLNGTGGPAPTPTATPPLSPSPTATPTASPTRTPAPTATPTPTPSPTGTPAARPTESPTATPSPSQPATVIKSYRGSVTARKPERTFTLSTGSGDLAASLQFSGAAALQLTLLDGNGQLLGTLDGPSTLNLTVRVPAGTKEIVVSTGGGKASFRLELTYAAP